MCLLRHFGTIIDKESDVIKPHNHGFKAWHTLYKSHNTFVKASTLGDALCKHSLLNNSRVFNDIAREGLMGLVPSQPFWTKHSDTDISWERVIVTIFLRSYKSRVSISNVGVELVSRFIGLSSSAGVSAEATVPGYFY
jgi:hypothetical protein